MARKKDGYAVEDGRIDRTFTPRKTRSERREEAGWSDDLARQLVALRAEEIARLPLSPTVRDAVEHAQQIRRHGAKRRQMMYLSKLLRAVDPEPVQRALEEETDGSAYEALERWRERILDEGDTAIEEFLLVHRSGDRQRIRQLARSAASQDDKCLKAKKQLFQILRKAADI